MIMMSILNISIQSVFVERVIGKEILLAESICALVVFSLLLTKLPG